nr:Protein FAR1-like sequence 6 [Ipomoea batatas]
MAEDMIIALYWGGDIIHGDQRGVRYSMNVADWLIVDQNISYDDLLSNVRNVMATDPSQTRLKLKCRYPITADSSEYVVLEFNSQRRWERILQTFSALQGRTGLIEVFVEIEYTTSCN